MKELQVKATGGTVTHRQKTVMIKNRKRMQNFFNSKSLMLIKADPLTYFVSINRKLAKKLGIDNQVQIKLFPEVNAIIIGKKLPFQNCQNCDIYDRATLVIDNPHIAQDIINFVNIDLSDSCAVVFRNISYQELGDGCFATVFLK